MSVDEYFADGVVVTDATTVVDTDALVVAALRVQSAGEEASKLEGRIQAARELILHRAALVPTESAWALHALEEARAEVSTLAGSCLSLSRALTSAALVYAAAEGDAQDFVRVWAQLRPGEAHGWATGLTSLHSPLPGPLFPGLAALTHPLVGPSLLAPGATWLQAMGVANGQIRHFTDAGRADGTEGLRLQMDAAALARVLAGETWSWRFGPSNTVDADTLAWWGAYTTKAPEAASVLSAWALGIGRLTQGPTSGVEITPSSDVGGTQVSRVVDSDASSPTVVGTYLAGVSPGYMGTWLATAASMVPVPQAGQDPARGARTSTVGAGTSTATPRTGAQLLSRISSLSSSGSGGQVEVLAHTTPVRGGGERRSWSVVIRGTQRWDVGGANPQDMLTNLQGIAGEDSDQVRAVRTAMEMAGIREGDVVEFTGHSQGGIVAAQMAADPQVARTFDVASVLTAGAPVAGAPVGEGVEMLNLENTGDPVPALDGSANTDRGRSTTVHFDGRHVRSGAGASALGPHDLNVYREAVEWMEQDGADRPEEVARWAARRATALGFTERTVTTSQLFDTRRVGPR